MDLEQLLMLLGGAQNQEQDSDFDLLKQIQQQMTYQQFNQGGGVLPPSTVAPGQGKVESSISGLMANLQNLHGYNPMGSEYPPPDMNQASEVLRTINATKALRGYGGGGVGGSLVKSAVGGGLGGDQLSSPEVQLLNKLQGEVQKSIMEENKLSGEVNPHTKGLNERILSAKGLGGKVDPVFQKEIDDMKTRETAWYQDNERRKRTQAEYTKTVMEQLKNAQAKYLAQVQQQQSMGISTYKDAKGNTVYTNTTPASQIGAAPPEIGLPGGQEPTEEMANRFLEIGKALGFFPSDLTLTPPKPKPAPKEGNVSEQAAINKKHSESIQNIEPLVGREAMPEVQAYRWLAEKIGATQGINKEGYNLPPAKGVPQQSLPPNKELENTYGTMGSYRAPKQQESIQPPSTGTSGIKKNLEASIKDLGFGMSLDQFKKYLTAQSLILGRRNRKAPNNEDIARFLAQQKFGGIEYPANVAGEKELSILNLLTQLQWLGGK